MAIDRFFPERGASMEADRNGSHVNYADHAAFRQRLIDGFECVGGLPETDEDLTDLIEYGEQGDLHRIVVAVVKALDEDGS